MLLVLADLQSLPSQHNFRRMLTCERLAYLCCYSTQNVIFWYVGQKTRRYLRDCVGYFRPPPIFISMFSGQRCYWRRRFRSCVYRKAPENGKQIVVKKLLATNNEAKKSLVKEARLLSKLQHPNVVEFKGMCLDKYAVLLEYIHFNFTPIGQKMARKAFYIPHPRFILLDKTRM